MALSSDLGRNFRRRELVLVSSCLIVGAFAAYCLFFGSVRRASVAAKRNLAEMIRHPSAGKASHTREDLFSRIPVVFEQNEGQADPSIAFIVRANSYTAYATPSEVLFALPACVTDASQRANQRLSPRKIRTTYLKMRFVDGDSFTKPHGTELLPWKTNYYMGKRPASWLTGIANYREIAYLNVYPGVDVIFHGDPQNLEMDMKLLPSVRPSTVKLHFEGARTIRVARSGDLLVRTTTGTLRLKQPVLYQQTAGRSTRVDGQYAVLAANSVGFQVGNYDHNKPLIIDPSMVYSTYLSGNNSTQALAIAVDSSGDAFVTGQTFANIFPTQTAHQPTLGGTANAFLTAFNPSGTGLIFSTYFGGNSFDQANGIAIDAQGNSYLVGAAGSSNFPTTAGAFLSPCAGASNCLQTSFIAKFDSGGSLIYSSLTGGSDSLGRAITVDAIGDAYITGTTASNDMPVVNAFQSTFAGTLSTASSNAFVQELDPSGSQLLYSTYLGGGGPNAASVGMGIALDASGAAYVVGSTNSQEFPVKAPLQAGLASVGVTNIFVTKFAPTGNSLVYSTYLGGSGGESPTAITVDGSGNAYITGSTTSLDFPLTQNAYRTTCSGPISLSCLQPQIFVLALNSSGNGLLYSTLFGAGYSNTIAGDSSGDVSIAGSTADPGLTVLNPIQASLQPVMNGDAFIATLNSSGVPTFATYLGGAGTGEGVNGIALDSAHDIYVAGQLSAGNSFPADFPLVSPFQGILSYLDGAFLTKISLASIPVLSISPLALSFTAVRNVSSVPLDISNISATNGTFTGTCGRSITLAPGTGCWMNIVATNPNVPTTLTVTSNAPGSPQSFNFPPTQYPQGFEDVLVAPQALSFPAQLVGTPSNPQTVTFLNPTSSPVAIGSMQIFGGDFSLLNNCPAVVAAYSSCQAAVTFTPSGSGQSGQLSFSSNSGPGIIYLSGITSQNDAYIPGQTYSFGTQLVGAPPLPRTINVTNASNSTLSVPISVSEPFSQVNSCSSPLSAHASCKVTVIFVPISNGPATGALTGGSQTVNLIGIGEISSSLTVTPLSVDFGTTYVGHPSNTQNLTLTNVSSAPVVISGYSFSDPQFSETNNCPVGPAAMAVDSSCTVALAFTPTSSGTQTGNITITPSTGNPQIVPLQGMGTTPLVFTPTSLDFGTQQIGTTSAPMVLSVGNNISTPTTIQSITVSGDFNQTGSTACPVSGGQLAGFTGCALNIVFAPTASGTRAGAVTVVASDSSTPHVVPLTGVGTVNGPPVAVVSPTSLTFPSQIVGTNSQAQNITLMNTGGTNLNISGVQASSGYAETNNCSASLGPGSSCSISVLFTPTQIGSEAGTATITDDAAGSPQTVSLAGDATNFVLATNSNQAVITAGQSATYNLQLSSDAGFTGNVTLSCTGAPQAATCGTNPSTVAVNGASSIPVTVTVTTAPRSGALAFPHFRLRTRPGENPKWARTAEILLVLVILAFLKSRRRRRTVPRLASLVLAVFVLTLAACSSGSSPNPSSNPPPSSGTPAGDYTLVVEANSAGVSRSVQITLVVN